MARIRIFINDFNLQAFLIEEDLKSLRLQVSKLEIDQAIMFIGPWERMGMLAKANAKELEGFTKIGYLREEVDGVYIITARYKRDGAQVTEIPLPDNLEELGLSPAR